MCHLSQQRPWPASETGRSPSSAGAPTSNATTPIGDRPADHSSERDELLLDFLSWYCRGRASATTGEKLARLLGTNKRSVQASIESLRRAEHLICSSTEAGGGYFVPVHAAEAQESISAQLHRVARQAEVARAQEKAFAKKFGRQLTLLSD